MSAIRKRLKKKLLQRDLDGIVESILKEHKGNNRQIVLALMTAKQELNDAGAKKEESVEPIAETVLTDMRRKIS